MAKTKPPKPPSDHAAKALNVLIWLASAVTTTLSPFLSPLLGVGLISDYYQEKYKLNALASLFSLVTWIGVVVFCRQVGVERLARHIKIWSALFGLSLIVCVTFRQTLGITWDPETQFFAILWICLFLATYACFAGLLALIVCRSLR